MDDHSISQFFENLLTGKKELFSYIDFFIDFFDIGELLSECGAIRRKGISAKALFAYLLGLMFEDISFNRDLKREDAPFSTNTVRRFLKDSKIDWEQFTTKLAKRIFDFLYPLFENPQAHLFLILDDTAYRREFTNFADDISVQKDHTDGSYYKGFRLSALSLYYNGLFLPVNGVLVSSADLKKLLYKAPEKTETPIVERRQKHVRSKLTTVIHDQIHWAYEVGLQAKYIIFDTWYTFPKVLNALIHAGFEVIGAVKNAKTKFQFEGEWYRIGELFEKLILLSPESDKDGIFFSPIVIAQSEEKQFPVRLIYAQNVNIQRPYFCVLSTDLSLNPVTVIRFYRYRWTLEVIFKELKKKTLGLKGNEQGLNLDYIAANIAIVFSRYLLLLSARALDGDNERSIQDQFYVCREGEKAVDELRILIKENQDLIPKLVKQFNLNKNQVDKFFITFMKDSELFRNLIEKIPKVNFSSISTTLTDLKDS